MKRQHPSICLLIHSVLLAFIASGCWNDTNRNDSSNDIINNNNEEPAAASSCMGCHNGAEFEDYQGTGIENPHPFPGAATLSCVECHGGDPEGVGLTGSHVPPPPEIGDEANQVDDAQAYFNRLTLVGLDKYGDYEVDGKSYTALDYLQFINPGDLRVTTDGRSCGKCHTQHSDFVARSPLATETGIFSGAMYSIGADNAIADNQGLYEDTAADWAWRAVEDPNFSFDPSRVGAVAELLEYTVFSVLGGEEDTDIFENPDYDADELDQYVNNDGRVDTDSPLANLYHEQIAFTCGDCHLGSAGANNRYGDFRSSGCTSCHMRYSLDGRSNSSDPNINKFEPANPDAIAAPERPHVERHMIKSVARTLATQEVIEGIDDYTCAGCHQGSNRTVMQYWGIRLDQNQDVDNDFQYPSNPVAYETTANDTRLFDPDVGNATFNGRVPEQYLLAEDYDGDGRDDTPADVHYDAGMGCIDCHGSHDLHGGTVGNQDTAMIASRQEQVVSIRCESCHGTVESYAETTVATTYAGVLTNVAVDSVGNPLRHVVREAEGKFFMTSRLTGERHYVVQTRDVVVDNGKTHPDTGEVLFNIKASYAMGRADGDEDTGLGPLQGEYDVSDGFSHSDTMSCVSCHAAWTNSCIGCHLGGEYDDDNDRFSNITGDRIIFNQANADFVYQTPVPFILGINAHNEIAQMAPNTKMFFEWTDRNGDTSNRFTFSDRNANGDNEGVPSLGHNALMPHSIRGKVDDDNEGPRYCVACHLTDEGLDEFGDDFEDFKEDLLDQDYENLDFDLLQEHIGENPGNTLNSPIWVHMITGLGSGMFLFDEDGCPVNPLDENDNRVGCNDNPADNFDEDDVVYDLDRIVNEDGESSASNAHPLLDPNAESLRDGANNERLAGPLGKTLLDRLVNTDSDEVIILDSWIDADGVLQGGASDFLE